MLHPTETRTTTIVPYGSDHDYDWTELNWVLSEPFSDSEIRYRPGAISRDKTKAQALAYADPRAYEDRLNAHIPGLWHVDFSPWGEHRIICRLTILDITRSSTGESHDSPEGVAGTSAEAQAFKRACAKFGLGRYLYSLEAQWVDYDPQTRRLLSTGHRPTTRTSRRTAQVQDPASVHATNCIGRGRAAEMSKQLLNIGLLRDAQLLLASQLLARPVNDLAELTEPEARVVWTEARARKTAANTVT